MPKRIRFENSLAGIFCFFLATALTQASGEYRRFRLFTGEDGLSQAVVQAIYQDRSGYLWIGTQAGLNRYDGRAFENFNVAQGLVHDWINDIDEDSRGRLWVATLGGVSLLDSGGIRNFTPSDGLADPMVRALAVDPNDSVWCATSKGVSHFDGSGWITYSGPDGLPSDEINDLILQPNGTLWAATTQGLAFFSDRRFWPVRALSQQNVVALAVDAQGWIWAATPDSVAALGSDGIQASYSGLEKRIGGSIAALWPDRYGVIWVGTPVGLGRIEEGEVEVITSKHGLEASDVRALREDREGLLWIGAMGGLVSLSGRAFMTYTQESGLGSNIVRPILRDSKGLLWVGTTGGLSRKGVDGWKTFTVADGLADDHIQSLLEDRTGQLWVGTRTGISLLKGDRFVSESTLRVQGRVTAIVEDDSGAIWCAVQTIGIFRRGQGGFSPVSIPNQTLSNARLLVDRQARLWVSGDRGLSRWDGKEWLTYTTADGLADDHPYFMCEDLEGHIWFGYHSSRGVGRFDGWNIHHFTTREGLANDAVYSLGVAPDGKIWIGTARGVDRFDGRDFIHYGVEEGFADLETNAGGFFADDDGTLWFGTMGGLSCYNPRLDADSGAPPTVAFRQITLNERLVDPSGRVEVPHYLNDLVARPAAFSFLNPKALSFEYRLLGFADEWTPVRGPELHITNLPPNRYTLEVRARKHRGPWSTPAQAEFTILTPLWQRWWALTLMSFGALGLVLRSIQFQNKRVRRQTEELERRVDERTRELALKNEELESFIYTVSHDLKAPVISLEGMASLLKEEMEGQLSPEAGLYLRRIRSNTRRMQHLINELLQLSRIGRLSQPKESVDMNQLVGEAVEALQGQIQINKAQVELVDNLPTVVCERSRMLEVWTNLLANALKYRRAEEPPLIKIACRIEDRKAEFRIEDNGMGIDPSKRERVFDIFYRVDGKYNDEESTGVGLAIVKKIIETHGGQVWAESQGRGQGSAFCFVIPMGTFEAEGGSTLANETEER